MINLDDLTEPILTELQQQILDYTDAREVTFDIDEMLTEAITAAGCADLDADAGILALTGTSFLFLGLIASTLAVGLRRRAVPAVRR